MSKELKQLVKELSSLSGPSGFESAVFDYIAEYIRPYVDEVRSDAMGNLLAVLRCGKPGAKMLLLDAHMDEIGLVVTAAEDGFLRFSTLGGVDARMLPACEVKILSEPPLFGVVDTMPPHVLSKEDMDKAVEADKLCIDAGLTQEEAERLVPPGTPVVFAAGCEELGEHALCGKAMDDRACVAILMKAVEELSAAERSYDLTLLISTQEEVGLRGATVGAWNAAPDYAIVTDTTFSRKTDGSEVTTELGKGAAIGVGPNMNRALTQRLISLAQEKDIPYHIEVCAGDSGTNAAAVQISRQGVATALVSLPIRYMHTPIETALLRDMESVRALITAFAAEAEV